MNRDILSVWTGVNVHGHSKCLDWCSEGAPKSIYDQLRVHFNYVCTWAYSGFSSEFRIILFYWKSFKRSTSTSVQVLESLLSYSYLTKLPSCLSIYLSLCLSVRPAVRLSVCVSIYLSMSLSVCLSISLSLSYCLYIYMSNCPPNYLFQQL